MAAVNQAMPQANSTSAAADEDVLWAEIVNTLTRGSDEFKAAFAQLQGSPLPFQTAMSVLAALPEDLGKRSQVTLRTWATRESKEQQALQEKKAVRVYELARLRLAPPTPQQQQRAALAKRARSSRGTAASGKRRAVTENEEIAEEDQCKHPSNCDKSSRDKTKGMCKLHGGQRRCSYVDDDDEIRCERVGKIGGFCKAHGGGRMCEFEGGCAKQCASRGFCVAHGGGKRCEFEGCLKSAQTKGLCIAHGGRKQCKWVGCEMLPQAKGMCSAHRARTTCEFEGGCKNTVHRKGLCQTHGKLDRAASD